jgi:PQQ-dependent dehydrogenase (methanol/ethanol family)
MGIGHSGAAAALLLLTASSVLAQTTGDASKPAPAPAGDDGQWRMVAKDYANRRYSELDQITSANAKDLRVAWTFDTGVNRGQEAAPLIIGQTMYVVTPFPNYLYALDLGSNGAMKWKYEPKPDAAAQGVACCDVVCRGCAYWEPEDAGSRGGDGKGGRVFYNTLDGHVVGVDAETGKELFKTKLGEINKGETITMAPIVVKGLVISGNSGGEFGVRGWIAAVYARSGEIAWRAYNTGPDADCKIGDSFKPFYEMDRGKDLGVSTWPPGQWKLGGSNVWGFISYDPELDLLYHGTGNPGVWNAELRPGDNKWSCGVFARKPDTGEAVWYYQWTPHDLFDWDGINENILLDLTIAGTPRKTLVHPDRNGYLYVLDRTSGEVLCATPFTRITTSFGVDLKTGRLRHNEEKKPKMGQVVRDVQPFAPGAKDWQPCAFSPKTGLLYIPHQNMTMDWEGVEANYIAGTPYIGVDSKFYAAPGGKRGVFSAIDPATGQKAWSLDEEFPVWSGALATAGDVVFYGTMEGWFKAVDARNGDLLWKFKCGSGIIGQPVTYRGPDGKQYVAILSGVGGWAGAIVAGGLDARDPSAAMGFVNGMSDLPKVTTKGGTLYVFALP